MRVLTRKARPAVATMLTAILLAATATDTRAQPKAPADGVGANENVYQVVTPRSELQIVEQFSRVFESPNRIVRVDGFDPDVITVSALSPNRIRVLGEKTGVTTLVITDEFDNAYSIEVFVAGDVRHLQAYLKQLFPEDDVEAVKLNDSIVLRGVVTEPGHITQIVDVALEFSTKVLNQMEVGGVHQVQLNTKVMEVQRTKMRQLGFNWILNTENFYASSTPGGVIGIQSLETPFGGPATVGFSGLDRSTIQFAIMGTSAVFDAFIDALRRENLLKILAEPKLVTTSGRPATILSGGEFPILVPQSLGTTTIEYREFGVRMEAVPIVLGNGRLRLDVAPEVSERDFSNSVSIDGFVVPGITTRRVNTQVEMRFGETLMIGGLIASRKAGSTNKVPFLGELPWIGTAFRTVRFEDAETELMILVTPHMVAPLQPHQVPPMGPGQFTDDPTDRELYLDGMIEVPLYGPECEGCGDMGAYGGGGYGAYPGGGYGGGAYGGGAYGGGAYGSGACLGDDCGPTSIGGGHQGVLQEGGYSTSEEYVPAEGAPADGPGYESAPASGDDQLPTPTEAGDSPVTMEGSPKLPPLPGELNTTQAEPTSGANRRASLGLINPFRRQVRTGEAAVEVESQKLEASAQAEEGEKKIIRTSALFQSRPRVRQAASSSSAN